MISTNEAHATLLESMRPLAMVELLTITLLGGTVLRYSSAPVSLSYGGNTYLPLNWERGEITTNLGLEVDNVELVIYPKVYPISTPHESQQDTILGLTWPQAVQQNVLFGAEVSLYRGDINPAVGPDIVGTLYLFSGMVAEPTFDNGLRLAIKSDLEVLNRQVPAQVYQPGCPYTLYDFRCGLNADDWVESSVAAAGSTTRVINCGLVQADGYFTLGKVEFLSGANAGAKRTVKSYTIGQLVLSGNLLYTPAIGDSFLVWPGCDKQRTTCNDKFSNTVVVDAVTVLRFGGQPFIPKPEAIL